MRQLGFATFLLLIGLVAAGCGGGGSEPTTTVTATMTDKAIELDTATVPAGIVQFTVVNAGTTVHSLALLKTDLPHDQIPADPADAAKVQQPGLLRETGQLGAGTTKEFTVRLAAGAYVLVCNEPAHYVVGMHTGFGVQ